MLAIQKFLRLNGPNSLKEATDKFGLVVYNEDPELVVLNYNMIDSPRGVKEVEECRGLVLERSTWNVVAFPFHRFYNLHENPYAAKVNLSNSMLLEKRDGTLCTLYHYDGWKVATRGRPMAEGNVGNSKKTFAGLFWETIESRYGNHWERMEFRNLNFVFELTSIDNRVLTPYTENDVRLLTIRHIDNYSKEYKEMNYSDLCNMADKIKIPLVKNYDFSDMDSIDELMGKEMKTLDEGFVVVDYTQRVNGSYKRIKIKNPRYLKAARLIGSNFNKYKAFELVLEGETEEFQSYFPEYIPLINKIEKSFKEYCDELDSQFKEFHSGFEDTDAWRKQFAISVQSTKNPSVMFSLLKDPSRSTSDIIRNDFKKTKKKFIADQLF